MTVSPMVLTFTTGNWATAQTVTATAVHDNNADDETVRVTHAADSTDSAYNASLTIDAVTVSVTDDETAGVTVTAAASLGSPVVEGGTGTYTVVLTSEPSADVTVTATSADAGAVTVSPMVLTFTTGNWATAQTVTATAVHDNNADDETVRVTHAADSTTQPWYRTWMDEAFSDWIYQWDMASMMWFAKYMHKAFDAMGSMDIFYQAQRDDGGVSRRIRESNGSGENPRDGEVNPPLFVWSEWQSFRLTGDLDRVRRVLPALREYIDWYSIVRWAQSSDHQLYWNEVRGSGNETLPRPYQGRTDGGKEWGDPDHSGMMAQAYLLLGELYDTVGDTDQATRMRAVGEAITERINRYMWKEFTVDGTTYGQWFYVNANGDIAPTSSEYADEPQTASLWVMTLGVDDAAKREQVKRLLDSEDWYNTDVPLGALPKSHSLYQGWGGYGLGQVMSPYTYAVIKGAETLYGYEYAQGFSEKYLDGIAEVYEYSDTIWEHYAPSKQSHTDITNSRFYVYVLDDNVNGRAPCPTGGDGRRRCEIVKTGYTLTAGDYAAPAARRPEDHLGVGVDPTHGPSLVKADFVGWGGIGPIALLIENVIGIQPDSIDKTITWHMTRTDRHGLNNLWLSDDLGKFDLIAAARTDSYSPAVITVTSANADTNAATTATLKIIHPSYEDCTTVHVITLNQANQQFTSQPCPGPGVGLLTAELVVAEGGTGTYMVRLATEPTADVTVTISGQAGTDVSLSGLTNNGLTFTTGNWDTSQTVTVTAAHDPDAADDEVTLTHTAASTDTDYEGLIRW